MRQRFLHAGIRHPQAVPAFFGIKALLTLVLPVLTFVACTLAGVLPLLAELRAALPATQSPNLFTLGPAAPFLGQKPFTV